ncbi:MAG TPA: polyamine ABC transporter ATP-binding protein [Firmicutes bacterium]|jgi:iron(III) transport system ATP-binding protein|nr:polyamine ABC transporter ATP-binding protein [Bacillota bacterium]
MSVNITIRNAVKRYGDNVVIPNLSLEIRQGEFFTLLGPSGCGKTTLLRMIAGFNTIEGGDFFFNDKRINDMDPAKRNIGMVFQNYAIFPHLTVRKNVAFGLKYRSLSPEQIRTRTEEFLRLVKIEELADRLPEQLSGGQQQRVALARALAIHPDVLLMDEPLSNLDAKLRVEMRRVIKEIQREIGITTVYVTHDQEEAMAISDRIAVMNKGEIQQVGTPRELYHRPANLFVASFIGRTNVLKGELYVKDGGRGIVVENRPICLTTLDEKAAPQAVSISIRPEDFTIAPDGSGQIKGRIKDSVFLGLYTHYEVLLPSGKSIEIIQQSFTDTILEPNSEVSLAINTYKINVFDAEGTRSLMARGA